jgi:hypothetical protein
MRDAYPDLARGNFISIADFETPGHEDLFRVVDAAGNEVGHTQPTLSILRARNETGAGGLKVLLPTPTDRLLFDGKRSQTLALVRDWRPYHLLLVSVYGPPGGAVLELTIESGLQTPVRWSRSLLAPAGWSVQRIDLATVGETIGLGDVRAVSLRAPQSTAPLEVYFDDFILADNTEVVLGAPDREAELYVLTRGRRIIVGAGGRFELAFHDGVLAAWQAPNSDNLVAVGGLGPWPLPLTVDWAERPEQPVAYDDPALFAAWGAAAAATQEIIEATPFRAVIGGQWRFAHAEATATAPSSVGHRWKYTIYPNGALYVQAESTAPPAGWSAPLVGYAVALQGRRGFEPLTPGNSGGAEDLALVLAARPAPAQADLLWTWPAATRMRAQRAYATVDGSRLALVVGGLPANPTLTVAHHFRVWPADIDGAPEAVGLARDYREPARVRLLAGRRITDAPGDIDQDGFNESAGCYEFALDGGVLRFELDPGALLRFGTVLRVRETAGRQCWVYARGRLVTDVGRDAADELLVNLGRLSGPPVIIEVHTQDSPAPPGTR